MSEITYFIKMYSLIGFVLGPLYLSIIIVDDSKSKAPFQTYHVLLVNKCFGHQHLLLEASERLLPVCKFLTGSHRSRVTSVFILQRDFDGFKRWLPLIDFNSILYKSHDSKASKLDWGCKGFFCGTLLYLFRGSKYNYFASQNG